MTDSTEPSTRLTLEERRVVRDALAVGTATAIAGLAFGAIAVASGFTAPQAITLSLAMFTGGSQFAYVGVLGSGGSVGAALSVAWMLGARNGLYSLQVRTLLPTHGPLRWLAPQLVIDESTAMAVVRATPRLQRLGFYATGLSVFVLWNLATAVGALAGSFVEDPSVLGLDAVFPAAFLALIWPQLRGRAALRTALVAGLVATALVPLTQPGVPIIAAAGAVVFGVAPGPGALSRGRWRHPRGPRHQRGLRHQRRPRHRRGRP